MSVVILFQPALSWFIHDRYQVISPFQRRSEYIICGVSIITLRNQQKGRVPSSDDFHRNYRKGFFFFLHADLYIYPAAQCFCYERVYSKHAEASGTENEKIRGFIKCDMRNLFYSKLKHTEFRLHFI